MLGSRNHGKRKQRIFVCLQLWIGGRGGEGEKRQGNNVRPKITISIYLLLSFSLWAEKRRESWGAKGVEELEELENRVF